MCSILVRLFTHNRAFGLVLAAVLLLPACRARDEQAARYAAQYDGYMANNDPWSARMVMQKAVGYDDSNPDYWSQLGRAQLAMKDYGAAFGSFLRANELARTDPGVLQTLADLAVMGGQLDDGKRYANQVLLLQPNDVAPQATLGFVALRQLNYDEALKRADAVLAKDPTNSNAIVLKARAWAATGQQEAAVTLLRDFIKLHPSDASAIDSLAAISGQFGDLAGQEAAQAQNLRMDPDNPMRQIDYAATLYAMGQTERAHAMTLDLVKSGRAGTQLIDILGLWRRYEPRATSLADVRALIPAASVADRMRYAYFLMLAGAPGEAEALIAQHVALPVTPANASPLALLAQARAMQGRAKEALPMLDAVLTFDPDNILALRARTDLYLRAGRGDEAVHDALRLVAAKPRAADDRVRLSRAYAVAGKPQLAENTLRAGIQDIPGSALLFSNLKEFLVRSGRRDELPDLDEQFGEEKRLARAQW
jgi:tetratricopeptide (TPR) repeat protein